MKNPETIFTLRSGLSIQRLSDSECAVLGGDRLIIYEGWADFLLGFIKDFSGRHGSVAEDVIERHVSRAQELGAQRADIETLFEQLRDDHVIVDKKPDRVYGRIVVVAPFAQLKSISLVTSMLSGVIPDIEIFELGAREIGEEDMARLVKTFKATSQDMHSPLLLAHNLDVHALYKVNSWARAQQINWLFVTRSGAMSFVSPVLHHYAEACFCCFRINSIGSLRDVVQNARVEAEVYRAPPSVVSRSEAQELTTCFHEAGALISQLERSQRRFPAEILKITPHLGTVASEPMMKVPGCLVCTL